MSLDDLKKIPYGKTAIELKNISLAFGGVKALTDVSFEIKKGESNVRINGWLPKVCGDGRKRLEQGGWKHQLTVFACRRS